MSMRMLSLATALTLAAAAPVAAQTYLDNHYLDSNEVFISSQEMAGEWMYVAIAQMLQQPSAATRGEGQFLVTGAGGSYTAGQRVWTRYYWRTRIAEAEDVRVGKQVFVPELTENEVYRQPRDRQEAMNGTWFLATITDVSDLYKQQVTVAGQYHVGTGALRVVR